MFFDELLKHFINGRQIGALIGQARPGPFRYVFQESRNFIDRWLGRILSKGFGTRQWGQPQQEEPNSQ